MVPNTLVRHSSRLAVDGEDRLQRFGSRRIVMIQRIGDDCGNFEEADPPVEESRDGDLIGGVEDRGPRAACLQRLGACL